jgi:hypothetical protein
MPTPVVRGPAIRLPADLISADSGQLERNEDPLWRVVSVDDPDLEAVHIFTTAGLLDMVGYARAPSAHTMAYTPDTTLGLDHDAWALIAAGLSLYGAGVGVASLKWGFLAPAATVIGAGAAVSSVALASTQDIPLVASTGSVGSVGIGAMAAASIAAAKLHASESKLPDPGASSPAAGASPGAGTSSGAGSSPSAGSPSEGSSPSPATEGGRPDTSEEPEKTEPPQATEICTKVRDDDGSGELIVCKDETVNPVADDLGRPVPSPEARAMLNSLYDLIAHGPGATDKPESSGRLDALTTGLLADGPETAFIRPTDPALDPDPDGITAYRISDDEARLLVSTIVGGMHGASDAPEEKPATTDPGPTEGPVVPPSDPAARRGNVRMVDANGTEVAQIAFTSSASGRPERVALTFLG